MPRLARQDSLALGVLLGAYIVLVRVHWFLVDDAFISFRYARNLANGHGLRFNVGDHVPVEGFSNFLWVLVCAVFEVFHVDVKIGPPVLSTVCGIVLVILVYRRLRDIFDFDPLIAFLASLSLVTIPPFSAWSSGGLATMPFALLLFWTFDQLVLRREGPAFVTGGIAALLLSLTRIEGIGWAFVIIVIAAMSRRGPGRVRGFATTAAILLSGYAIYTLWRWSYFHTLIPHTAAIKAGGPALWGRGFKYVATHFTTFLLPFGMIPGTVLALRKGHRRLGVPVAAMAWGVVSYSILATGDWMPMSRFLVAGLTFQTLLWGWVLAGVRIRLKVPGVVLVGFIAAGFGLASTWDIHVLPESVRARYALRSASYRPEIEALRSQQRLTERQERQGRLLAIYVRELAQAGYETPRSIVCSAIGAVAYHSNLFVYDRFGLVSADVISADAAAFGAPGHDRSVMATHFLEEYPGILRSTHIPLSGSREIEDVVKRFVNWWRVPEVTDVYVPNLMTIHDPEVGDCLVASWIYAPAGPVRERLENDLQRTLDELGLQHVVQGDTRDALKQLRSHPTQGSAAQPAERAPLHEARATP